MILKLAIIVLKFDKSSHYTVISIHSISIYILSSLELVDCNVFIEINRQKSFEHKYVILVIICVTIQCSTLTAENVLQFSVWKISALRWCYHYQSIVCWVYPLIGTPITIVQFIYSLCYTYNKHIKKVLHHQKTSSTAGTNFYFCNMYLNYAPHVFFSKFLNSTDFHFTINCTEI